MTCYPLARAWDKDVHALHERVPASAIKVGNEEVIHGWCVYRSVGFNKRWMRKVLEPLDGSPYFQNIQNCDQRHHSLGRCALASNAFFLLCMNDVSQITQIGDDAPTSM